MRLLEASGIGKRYSGVRALGGVDLTLERGEVLALIGENGAGKSTLMKILAGVQEADEGEIRIDGKPVRFRSVADAMDAGIALIHQELNLAPNLDAASNIFLGREPRKFGLIDETRMRREAAGFLEMAGLAMDPAAGLEGLSTGKLQQVEIAKALSVDARILIMDEPTSSLSQAETEVLFGVIRSLKSRGVAVIYISHRLGEVTELADRVSVLRDGANAGELARGEVDRERMIRLMVGRDLSEFYPGHAGVPGEVLLEVEKLRTSYWPDHEVSFRVRAGEVVGVAGLVGAGRSELLRCLFGIDRPLAGVIRVRGVEFEPENPRRAIAAGLALVPEDRKTQGLVLEMGVPDNLALASLWRDRRRGGWVNEAAVDELERRMGEAMRIKAAPGQAVGLLSGGNQQKVAFGKWLAMEPAVLLLDEPTRGVDVGAKREIHTLMAGLAERGKAVLFVSSDLEEVLGMADRVLVMHEGRLAGELDRGEASEESVMRLATGTKDFEAA
ncbi:sugar ABC transporter ATP-binding protein [Luteolibacter marinus]|uniref:sugar ABC transporter ATP-binding protein n=1 Tax=Luteolibacter marinus TaxID=2776705 RepID=UPI001865D45F|nr:sugar ABC transporter ATP-binding protein [Luteolibacter marinus]